MIALNRREPALHPVVHLVGCGTRPTRDLPRFATSLRTAGWDPYLIPSPVGRHFLDLAEAEERSNHVVRWDFDPGDPVELPRAQLVVAAPASFNTITKLGAGIADTLALAVINEAVGGGMPVLLAPWANAQLSAHPAYVRAVASLRSWGVRFLPTDQSEPFPWPSLQNQMDSLRP
ncbi:flavoprotein [Streptomyces caatingaensis]|uniref:flavoprotein n=1 Tax=Streptomyces caatingaensis TaxID=1678637 RepID=UPI00099B52C5|nr:flavoprotein [Streptomyces caatingaensis]